MPLLSVHLEQLFCSDTPGLLMMKTCGLSTLLFTFFVPSFPLSSLAVVAQPDLSVLRFMHRTIADRRSQVLNELLIIY